MSRSIATFTFDDGNRLYGLYNGTVDYMQQFLTDSEDAAWEAWRVELIIPLCEDDGEHVVIHNSYGGGETWEGKACRSCSVFKGPFRSPATAELFD